MNIEEDGLVIQEMSRDEIMGTMRKMADLMEVATGEPLAEFNIEGMRDTLLHQFIGWRLQGLDEDKVRLEIAKMLLGKMKRQSV